MRIKYFIKLYPNFFWVPLAKYFRNFIPPQHFIRIKMCYKDPTIFTQLFRGFSMAKLAPGISDPFLTPPFQGYPPLFFTFFKKVHFFTVENEKNPPQFPHIIFFQKNPKILSKNHEIFTKMAQKYVFKPQKSAKKRRKNRQKVPIKTPHIQNAKYILKLT